MDSFVRSAGQVMDDDTAGYLRDLAEALRETAQIQREIQQAFATLHGAPRHTVSQSRSRPVSHRGPLNPLHQTWRSFALDLQHLEAIARRERFKLTKANVARFGVDTVKTI